MFRPFYLYFPDTPHRRNDRSEEKTMKKT